MKFYISLACNDPRNGNPTGYVDAIQVRPDGDIESIMQPRHYLVQPGDVPKVEDCGFRMLQPHEIQAAMAFPADYTVLGTKRERVKQLGNAVTPPAMSILMQRVMETFN